MASKAILIEAPEYDTTLEAACAALREAGVSNITVISSRQPQAQIDRFISCRDNALQVCLREAVTEQGSKKVFLFNGDYTQSAKDIKKFLADAAERQVAVAGVKVDKEKLDLGKLQAKTLVPLLSAPTHWPAGAMAFPATLVEQLGDEAPDSAVELFVQLLVTAVGKGIKIEKATADLKVEPGTEETHPLQLTGEEGARCLKRALESCNIEDLFPQHPWNKFQEESLAASYHTLAALFVRLGDFESAEAAIAQSQSFEDSPRALALRGLLAIKKRDFLGASAHLIAALQLYEARLKDPIPHYVTFSPKNFKRVNEILLAGLGSLNAKDNQKAAISFLEAIFLYDSFFHELGVAKLSALQ